VQKLYQQEWKCYAPSNNKMFVWKPAANVVNVPAKYLRFTQRRTCLKTDMVEMLKCSKKMIHQKVPDEKQSFQEVLCSLAEVLRPEDLSSDFLFLTRRSWPIKLLRSHSLV